MVVLPFFGIKRSPLQGTREGFGRLSTLSPLPRTHPAAPGTFFPFLLPSLPEETLFFYATASPTKRTPSLFFTLLTVRRFSLFCSQGFFSPWLDLYLRISRATPFLSFLHHKIPFCELRPSPPLPGGVSGGLENNGLRPQIHFATSSFPPPPFSPDTLRVRLFSSIASWARSARCF